MWTREVSPYRAYARLIEVTDFEYSFMLRVELHHLLCRLQNVLPRDGHFVVVEARHLNRLTMYGDVEIFEGTRDSERRCSQEQPPYLEREQEGILC